MRWIVLSLLAPAIYAGNSFIDKYVLERKIRHASGMPIYSTAAALVLGTAAWLLAGMPVLGARDGWLLVASGMTTLYALTLYFYALRHNHTSHIITLLQTVPLYTLLLSAVFLGERLNGGQLAGFLVTLCAVMGLTVTKFDRRLRLGRGFWAMAGANLLFATSALLVAYTVELEAFMPTLIYQSWGLALAGLTLFVSLPAIRRAFVKSFRHTGGVTLSIMFLNETLFNIANALTFLAISLGPVALVTVLGGTQIFYGLLFGVVLSVLFPGTFKEGLTKYQLAKKVIFSALLFGGVALIAVSSS
jgi:drug/metabolite transporter (DMT)-like permease